VSRRGANRGPHRRRHLSRRPAHFVTGDFDRAGEAIEFTGISGQRSIAVAPNGRHDLCDATLGGRVPCPCRGEQSSHRTTIRRFNDSDHSAFFFRPKAEATTTTSYELAN
jgi:hypothetical protein